MYDSLGADSAIKGNPFKMPQAIEFDAVKAAARMKLLDELIGALLVDTHDELVAGWKSAGDKAQPQFFAPPLTEAEAKTIADTKWKNEVEKNDIIKGWQSAAREKYAAD